MSPTLCVRVLTHTPMLSELASKHLHCKLHLRRRLSDCLVALYAGNLRVLELAWSEPSQTLLASGSCLNVNRFGQCYQEDYDLEDSDEDTGYEHAWPKRAKHPKVHFPAFWNAFQNGMIEYRFKKGNVSEIPSSAGPSWARWGIWTWLMLLSCILRPTPNDNELACRPSPKWSF